jgi:alkylation response protein AidB-like acyl-CoA dehydrogenase
MNLHLPPAQQSLLERVRELAREKIAPRAAHYDRAMEFPHEDFDELFQAGLLAPAIPKAYGGLGLGPLQGDAFTLWMMTKELAKADLSLGRCWEGHVNSLVLLDGLGSEPQKARWFEGVVRRGEKWVAWSGEPQVRAPGETVRVGTSVKQVEGGYVLEGTKVFATSSTGARWAILLVNTAGPGGARHATASPDSLLLLACDLTDPSIQVDPSWWDPLGMRATVSHRVEFQQTFIPEAHRIGNPGQYLLEGWQTFFVPHYAASFWGLRRAPTNTPSLTCPPRAGGRPLRPAACCPHGHQRGHGTPVAAPRGPVVGAGASLRGAAGWQPGALPRRATGDADLEHCIHACGARSLNRPSPVERIFRDLTFYARHDNDDHILATIGRALLGLSHDASFYKP